MSFNLEFLQETYLGGRSIPPYASTARIIEDARSVKNSADNGGDTGGASRWIVVDDNSGILQVVSAILSAITDTQIDCYESGEHALRDYDAHPDEVDLVITDLDMPGMNGLELCQALRRRRGDLKIVLMTGNHGAIDPDSARLCGFDGLMYKPFLPIDLRKLLENVGALEQRPAQGTTRWSRAI